MRLIDNFREFLLEEDLRINIYKNRINIVNYITIHKFTNNLVMIKHDLGDIFVNGENLVVKKLLNKELLIEGTIKSVELKWKKLLLM